MRHLLIAALFLLGFAGPVHAAAAPPPSPPQASSSQDDAGNIQFTFNSQPSIKVAPASNASVGSSCVAGAGATNEGAIRYNRNLKNVEFCDGATWKAFAGMVDSRRWYNVTASRAFNTIYTNNSSTPIIVSVSVLGSGSMAQLWIDGVYIGESGGSGGPVGNKYRGQLSGIVPVGSTYSVQDVGTYPSDPIDAWAEFR